MEESINGELTFRMIWKRIKLSGVRILVYVLIALIVGAGILGVADLIFSKSQFETRITYYYEGVEEGLDPWGGKINFVNGIKSVSNVTAALRECKYNDEEIAALTDPVIKNLAVVVDMTNEKKNSEEIITQAQYNFRIILSQSGEIDKNINSKNDYYNIVSAITSNYIQTFKTQYSYTTHLVPLTVDDTNSFITKYNIVKNALNQFVTEITTLNEISSKYVSPNTNITFGSLLAKATSIEEGSLAAFKDVILSNSVNSGSEQQTVKNNIEKYFSQVQAKEKEVKTLQDTLNTISNMPNGGTSTSTGTIVINPPDYKELLATIDKATDELTEARLNYAEWVSYADEYGITNIVINASDSENKTISMDVAELEESGEEVISQAKAKEDVLIEQYNSLISIYKEVIEDYNESANVQNLVGITSQTTKTKDTPVTVLVFIIIEAVLLILAVIVAMGVTAKKGEMILRKNLNLEKKNKEENVSEKK